MIKKLKLNKPGKILGLFISIAFVVGLGLSIYVFNLRQTVRYEVMEINFIDSHQAIIFWKTKEAEVGYAKYGKNPLALNNVAEQTSSKPSQIHTVVIDNIPLEGIHVSLHAQGESRFLWAEAFEVKYKQESIDE